MSKTYEMTTELDVEAITPAKPKASTSDSDSILISQMLSNGIDKTFQESSYHPDSQKKPYNPDSLVMNDYTYGTYEQMLDDDHINVALQLKKDLVVGSGWYLSTDDASLKGDLESILNNETDRPLSEMLIDILQAYEFGFSLSEKIFKKIPDGIALKDIKPRHPSSWLIHTNEYGVITRYEQRGRSNSIDVDPNALIHYVNNDRFQNPYGVSDLRAAYQAYTVKKHVIRFYSIFLENAAGPKPVAKFDTRAPSVSVDDVYNVIKKFQAKTAIVIPKEFDIEFLETKSNGEQYIKGINLFNMFIGRALFIPDLIGFTGSETSGGSFSLGKEQIGLFYKHIYKRREILERIINKHIITPICQYNYGLMDKYPEFKFKALSDEDAVKQGDLWIRGVQGAGWTPTLEEINHFRSLVKFPQSDEIEMKQPVVNVPFQSDESEEKTDDDKQKQGTKNFSLPLSTLPGDYKNRVDFKLADSMLKSVANKIVVESEPLVDEMFEALLDSIDKKKIIQKKDINLVDSIKLVNLKKLQLVFKRNFRRLYNDAKDIAMAEVNEFNKKEFAKKNIPTDEFLKFLEDETFRYIGDYSYTITKKTKDALVKAIKDKGTIQDVETVLSDAGKKLSDVSIERFARTKSTEVLNKGRMASFEASGVVEAYQYSAILDDRTSELCEELHGRIFKADEAPIPPLHFNALHNDSLIITSKGLYPIDQIKVNDKVLTHNGNWCRVYDVMSKFEDKEYYEIDLNNGQTLKATGEHPILIRRNGILGWLRVDELSILDDVICFEDVVNERKVV